jgi:hypothetical protein
VVLRRKGRNGVASQGGFFEAGPQVLRVEQEGKVSRGDLPMELYQIPRLAAEGKVIFSIRV